jgi:AcrR family transcriptional regulator
MRTLAAELGTSTSALYRHFPSKEWLLIAIVEHVFADVRTAPHTISARGRLEELSWSFRDVLSAHAHLHEVLTSHVVLTPSTVRIAEAAMSALLDLGVSDGELIDAYNAWGGYVIGFTAVETHPSDPAPDPQLETAMRKVVERASATDLPIVASLPARARGRAFGLRWQRGRLGESRRSFEWGLRALIDGFEQGQGVPDQEGRHTPR